MLSLPELQSRLGQGLSDKIVGDLAIRGNGLSAPQRLQVYRHNMQSALMGALKSVYPTIERLVGEAFFEVMAVAYLETEPSRSGNIQDYGRGFAGFIRGYEPAASLAYLADVAELEWCSLEASLAPEHAAMDLAALAAVPSELQPKLRFRVQPAVRVLRSRFPVLTLWEYCRSPAPHNGLDIDLPAERVLFARPDLDVYMRRLSPGEDSFLQRLMAGDTFEQACLAALEAESGFDMEKTFAALVREEILTGFYN